MFLSRKAILVLLIEFIILLFGKKLTAQSFLNGDFEINSAIIGTDSLNLTTTQFNSTISNCYSFGLLPELDLISTTTWAGGPKSGNWYIGISGGLNDQLSIQLDTALTAGNIYAVSYYDKLGRANNPCYTPVEIGLSTSPTNFGTLIYTGSSLPILGEWTYRIFSFNAPNNGQYITVRIQSSVPCWVNVDQFCIDTVCIEETISILTMPNVFTPNLDGINETFSPIIFENINNATLKILNRWGQVIYETENLLDGWDGEEYSDGVYFWQINYTDTANIEKIEHGFVHLIR